MKLAISAVISLAFAMPVMASQNVILDFEAIDPSPDELAGAGDFIFEDGYVLEYTPADGEPFPVGFHAVGESWRFNGRSTALVANSCSAAVLLLRNDNQSFRLRSIDLAAFNGDGPVWVFFSGTRSDFSQIEMKATLNPKKRGWQRFKFPSGWRDLQSVVWAQGDCVNRMPHMVDNIKVSR